MALAWTVLALLYLILLFWIATWGDRNSPLAKKITSHPAIYSLALAIYCTAWTFFGAVGEASRNAWNYLPILLGPILLYLFGYKFILKLALVSKKQHINTIADFIASRYGKRHSVALMVTLIALLAAVPYIALQLKAISAAFQLVSGQQDSDVVVLIATVFIAVFSIYFGTKRTDVTEYRRGLMLAIAFESSVKLFALAIVALVAYVYWQDSNSGSIWQPLVQQDALDDLFSFAFIAQTLMAAAAVICLPRQFHVAIIDNLSLSHIKTARWLFPIYLGLTALVIPIIAVAGNSLLGGHSPDTYVLQIAILSDSLLIKMLVFIGGLSAATAMIVVASLTLSTMITNDVILPKLLARHHQKNKVLHYSQTILRIRRVVIALLLALAYVYHQQLTGSRSLASIGLIAFSLVIQLLPAIIGGLYWKGGHAHGVYAGLAAGMGVWVLYLVLPVHIFAAASQNSGQESGLISLGAMLALFTNSLAYVGFSRFAQPRLIDRIQAQSFVKPAESRTQTHKKQVDVNVDDLITLLNTFLGETRCQYLLDEYKEKNQKNLTTAQHPPQEFLNFCERALGGVIGAASANALINSALSGKKLDFEEVVNFFDDTTQAIQVNMSALLTSIESIEQGISVIDKNLNLVAWNQRYLDFFDYPEELIGIGNPIESLVRYNAERGECGVGKVEDLVSKRLEHLRHGTAHRFVRERSDGRMIEMVGNPLPGGGFVTSFNDITTHIEIQKALEDANIDLENRIQKRSEEVQKINAELRKENERRADIEHELIRARQAAEEANASKTRFLALASHDIIQPLNAAKLYLSALQEMPLEPAVDTIVHKLNHSVSSSETLIATILDIARLDQGDLSPNFEAHSLSQLLSPLIDEFRMKAEEKGLKLIARTPDVWVSTDKTYLYRIAQNLLSNAVKYTPHGKVMLSIRPRATQVLFEVRDTGMGIPKAEHIRIFSDFYRVDGTKERGVGLGLGVVTRLSKQLNCHVKVISYINRGSCFSLSLPRVAPQASDSNPRSPLSFNVDGLRILCVDDQQENLDALETLLTKWKVHLQLARNRDEAKGFIDEALHATESDTTHKIPQVLLVDYHLGNHDNGVLLIRDIRSALAAGIPAILLTANREDSLLDQCKKQDIHYLNKPLKPAKLRVVLQNIFRELTSG